MTRQMTEEKSRGAAELRMAPSIRRKAPWGRPWTRALFGGLVAGAIASVIVLSCGPDQALRRGDAPSWASISNRQSTTAQQLGLPAALENSIGMRFVLIPGGRFVMGSPADEAGRDVGEVAHDVTVSDFYMQTTEVTNQQYRLYKTEHDSGTWGWHSLDGERQPAARVSWDDAVEFCSWLTAREQARTYRLPTEAEWEYACRAGSQTRFSFGQSEADLAGHANTSEVPDLRVAAVEDQLDGHIVTSRVGAYPPNQWGLHDMHGNLQEWCSDWYSRYSEGLVRSPTGPKAPVAGALRMVRGGWWHSGPAGVRCATRRAAPPEMRYLSTGFRVVGSPDRAKRR